MDNLKWLFSMAIYCCNEKKTKFSGRQHTMFFSVLLGRLHNLFYLLIRYVGTDSFHGSQTIKTINIKTELRRNIFLFLTCSMAAKKHSIPLPTPPTGESPGVKTQEDD